MTRSPTLSPAAETTTRPRTSGSAAPRRSPPGPTSPASPWLHNHAYRRPRSAHRAFRQSADDKLTVPGEEFEEPHTGTLAGATTSAGSVAEATGTSWFMGTAPCSGFDNLLSAGASPFRSQDPRRRLCRGCRCPRHGRLGDPPKPDDRHRSENRRRASQDFWRSDQWRAVVWQGAFWSSYHFG